MEGRKERKAGEGRGEGKGDEEGDRRENPRDFLTITMPCDSSQETATTNFK